MFRVRTATAADLPATAELHKTHLDMGLFPHLGRRFLRVYQGSFIRSPYGIALVAESDGEIVGALFGTTENAEHYRWVVRHCGTELALAGASAMLFHPDAAWMFARTRMGRYIRGVGKRLAPTGTARQPGPSRPVPVLSHIVTSTSVRKQGVGRRLVEAFRVRASRTGAQGAVLVTEQGGLGTPFFEKLGCALVKKRQGQDGKEVREYRLPLKEATAYEEIGRTRRGRNFVRTFHPRMGAGRSPTPASGGLTAR